MSDSKYVNIFAHKDELEYYSQERNINFLLGHYGFWLFNVVNTLYLIFVEGYALQTLKKNRLHQNLVAACFVQILSCMCSLTRYNANIEFSFWGKLGTLTGCIALQFLCAAVTPVFFLNSNESVKWEKIISWITAIMLTTVIFLTYIKWEDNIPARAFSYFQPFVILTTVYHIGAFGYAWYNLKKDTITIDPSIIGKEEFQRLLIVLVCANVLILTIKLGTGIPWALYTLTGATYTNVIVFTKYAWQLERTPSPSNSGASSLL